MFWEPTSTVGNALPGPPVQNVADPCSFRVGHVKKVYPDPVASSPLAQMPERATVKIRLQAIGDDVSRISSRAATSIRRCPRPSPATIWAAGPPSSGPGPPPRPTSTRSQAPRFPVSPPGCGKAIRYQPSVTRPARRPPRIPSALSRAPDPSPRGCSGRDAEWQNDLVGRRGRRWCRTAFRAPVGRDPASAGDPAASPPPSPSGLVRRLSVSSK